MVDDAVPDHSLRTVFVANGRSVQIDDPLGEANNPVSLEDVESKFHLMADRVHGKARARGICAAVDSLFHETEVMPFIKSLAL